MLCSLGRDLAGGEQRAKNYKKAKRKPQRATRKIMRRNDKENIVCVYECNLTAKLPAE